MNFIFFNTHRDPHHPAVHHLCSMDRQVQRKAQGGVH